MFKKFIKREKNKPYFKVLVNNIEKLSEEVLPKEELWFNALELTPFNSVKVVILGQDPYHNENQATGLAFSVNNNVKVPPSLRNIYKELNYEYGYEIPNHGNLTSWATEGVLLLNTILTVSLNKPLSHKGLGWEIFINNLFELLQEKDDIIYLLLGNYAKSFKSKITNKTHVILESSHPSPLSFTRGFYKSNIFKKCNEILINKNIKPINWQIK